MVRSVEATYLERLVNALHHTLNRDLAGVYLGGSLALDDYRPGTSDLDVLGVTRSRISRDRKDALVGALSHRALPCPATGLDLLIYAAAAVRHPARQPHFEVSLTTGADWQDEIAWGGPYGGGLIDLAIVRRSGRALAGPPPATLIGEISPTWIEEELRRAVAWHRGHVHHPLHDPLGANAVLNAARARRFRAERALVSKTDGAAWLARREPHSLLDAAVAARTGGPALPRADVVAFLDRTLEALTARDG